MVVIRESKTFYFDFDWPKDVDENLKNEIDQLLLKYNHGKNIHEHEKQQNE